MTQYNLNHSGQDVDLAIEKSLAHLNNIDTAPDSSSTKAVTSQGIKTALDAKINTSAIVTNFDSPNDTTVPSSDAVKDFVDGNILWARTEKTMTQFTGGLTWSNTIKHSSFTGFSISGQQITIPTGKYFINITWTNSFESGAGTYADWYLMKDAIHTQDGGTVILQGRKTAYSELSCGSGLILDGGNYFMKVVSGYITGTVYVNVIKIGV